MSAREDLLAYLANRLGTVSGVTVYRSRQAAVAREEGTCVVLEPEEEQVVKISGAVAVRDMVVIIAVIIRGIVPDSAADPILQSITQAIQADDTLQGRAAKCIEQSTKWSFEMADVTALMVEVRFLVKYLTSTTNIASL
jgi:hypothetical protein